MMSIVTTGEKNGYYVDIFRSRKVEGGDKMHDYFYHNMGQTMNLTAADGSSLFLQPTEELALQGHIYMPILICLIRKVPRPPKILKQRLLYRCRMRIISV